MAYYSDDRGRSSHRHHYNDYVEYDDDYRVYDAPTASYRRDDRDDRDDRDYHHNHHQHHRSQSHGTAPVVRHGHVFEDDDNDNYSDTRRAVRHASESSVHRRHRRSSTSSSGVSDDNNRNRELKHAVTSALAAGVVEAFRLRNSPGSWSHDKAGRVATAAIESTSQHHHGGSSSKHVPRHVVEATLAGLLTDRIVNGSRRK